MSVLVEAFLVHLEGRGCFQIPLEHEESSEQLCMLKKSLSLYSDWQHGITVGLKALGEMSEYLLRILESFSIF